MSLGEIIYHVIFYGFALLTVCSAMIVAFSKNILRAAFALLLTFFGVAGLYVFLAADFIAAAQILIYVGGILVLILFAIMLTHNISNIKLSNPVTRSGVGGLIALMVLAGLIWVIVTTDWPVKEMMTEPTTEAIGKAIMGPYLLPFEAVSVLLLAALIGAAYLARSIKSPEAPAATALERLSPSEAERRRATRKDTTDPSSGGKK